MIYVELEEGTILYWATTLKRGQIFRFLSLYHPLQAWYEGEDSLTLLCSQVPVLSEDEWQLTAL